MASTCSRLLCVLLAGLPVVGCQPAGPQPTAVAPPSAALPPLPPALAGLLAPATAGRQDVSRLLAARAQWAGDSLGRLLVLARLGADYGALQAPDTSLRYLQRAWWEGGARHLGRQQPQEVLTLAQTLAHTYYEAAAYDSARHYFRVAAALFRQAGLDSTRPATHTELPSHRLFTGSAELPAAVAQVGLASRRLGDLPTALRCYERAAALYQQQANPDGALWTQSLVGEAYAEQGDDPRATGAYEQALDMARRFASQRPVQGAHAQANLLLKYYLPLLLARPAQWPYATRLAAEATTRVRQPMPGTSRPIEPSDALLLAQLALVPAEVALRRGQPQAAAPPLATARHWLTQATALSRPNLPTGDIPSVAALALGLQAWQQHATNPQAACQLLAQAATRLAASSSSAAQTRSRQQVATYCLAMHEPAQAVALLHPLVRRYQQPFSPLPLSEVTGLLTRAYAALGRYDSAYTYGRRTQGLRDTVRTARQFAALAATEARFRTREQAQQIQLLTERSQRQTLRGRLMALAAAALALLLLLAALAWRTTRRLNQQLAAQAERLRQLDEAKNQFFANVSHELRTPLMLVLGPLRQALALTQSVPLRELLATSTRHGQHLRQLIDRILDLTKLEAGKLAAHPVPTPLAALLRQLVAQFEPLAAERQVQLRGPQGLPDELRVRLDADKLGQILTNLLANALQHTPPGGQVSLTARRPGPDQYALTVHDTGPGIAPAEQAQVFERFYQSPQRQARGGTGLGLALSRELTQLLGGTLTLASEPGQGATFTLTFGAERLPDATPPDAPLADGGAQPVQAAPSPAGSSAAPRPVVVLAEDHAELRTYVRQLLTPACHVLEAANGQQALTLLAREAVDLVVSDAMMPYLSGLELLQALRRDTRYQHLPFLMLTARADEAHRFAALAVGVDDYLIKPFDDAELLARVRTLLARHQVRQRFASLPVASAEMPLTAAPMAASPGVHSPRATAEPTEPDAAQLTRWQALVAPSLPDPAFGPAELAALLLLSERTLYRRLGELAGLTPAAWLRELRLTHARRLLEAGTASSVAEVAEAAGFANAKWFGQRYAERFGRRPSSYFS